MVRSNGSNKVSFKAVTQPTLDGSNCATIAGGSSCKINIKASSVGTSEVTGTLNGKEVVSFSTSTYPMTVTNSGDLSNALVLGNYPSTLVVQPNSSTLGSYYGSMSLSVVNQYNAAIDVSNLFGKLPTNVTWSPINCPNPLPFGGVCQVRLAYNGAISSNVTVNLRPNGSLNGTVLQTQSSSGAVLVTSSKIASLNVAYPSLSLDGNNPTTNNSTIGYITNNGTSTATISGITINNDTSSIFSISNNSCRGELKAGASCKYTIIADVSKLSSTASGVYSDSITVKYNNGKDITEASGLISYDYVAKTQSGSTPNVLAGLSLSGIIPSSIYGGEANTISLTLTNNSTATNGGNATITVNMDRLTQNLGTNLSGHLTAATSNACSAISGNITLGQGQSCNVNLVLTGSGSSSTTTATIAPSYEYYTYARGNTGVLSPASGAQLPVLSGSVVIQVRSASLNLAFYTDNTYTTPITSLSVEQSGASTLTSTAALKVTNTGTTALTDITMPNVTGFIFTPDNSCSTLAAGASCNVAVSLNSTSIITPTDITTDPANIVSFTYSNHLGNQTGSTDMPSLTYQVTAPGQPQISVSTSFSGCGGGTTSTTQTCNLNPGSNGRGTVGAYKFIVTYTNSSTTSGVNANNFTVTAPGTAIATGYSTTVSNNCNNVTLNSNSGSCTVEYTLISGATSGNISQNAALGSYSYNYGDGAISLGSINVTNPNQVTLNIGEPVVTALLSKSSIAETNDSATLTVTVSNWWIASLPNAPTVTGSGGLLNSMLAISGTAYDYTVAASGNGTGTASISVALLAPDNTTIHPSNNPLSITVMPPPYFVAYYPTGCTVNVTGAGITGTCECIRDPTPGGKIWTATGPNDTVTTGTWNDWTGGSLTTYNQSSHCGLTGNWSLPSATNPNYGYMSSSNPGGDWGDLAVAALANGYITQNNLGTWMNNNGFKGITSNYYWSSQSDDDDVAWGVVLYDGFVYYAFKVSSGGGVLLVHP